MERTHTVKCANCGCEFVTSSTKALYCRSCRSKAKWAGFTKRVCDTCGNSFSALYNETTCDKCRSKKFLNSIKEKRVCLNCGGPVEHNKHLCDKCRELSNRIESTCVVCGKKFLPKKKDTVCKTCSRTCQGYYIQMMGFGMKYNTDDLHSTIIEYIKDKGVPMSLDDLGIELGGITRKVFSTRGWTMKTLLKDAGINIDWFPKGTSNFEKAVYYIIREVVGDNITIETQKIFPDLKGEKGGTPRFDFYLPDYNLIIEADGRQHYEYDNPWGQTNLKENDNIKNKYCCDNNIGLLIIRYEKYAANRENIKNVLINLLPPAGEIRQVNCFNCWNGSELVPIPISNQAP